MDLLQCPLCEAPLEKENTKCTECEYESFALLGIPWLFQGPKKALAEWQNRFELYMQELSHEGDLLEAAIASDIMESTRKRLRQLKKDKQKYSKALRTLLQPLSLSQENTRDLHRAYKTQVPLSQSLMSYYTNLHRDWGWGEKENQISLDLVAEALGSDPIANLVTLGSGACRLSYDLHRKLKPESSLAVDINPFYLLLAQKMVGGEEVDLHEFTLAPKTADDAAIESKLVAPEKVENFHFVLGDALQPPIKSGSADVVLTPWLIDIIPQDIDIFFRQVNRILKTGGRWVNFGSFAFHHQDPAICYTVDEVFEVAENAGFKISYKKQEEIPYLQSPHSCQKRFENVLIFTAEKVKEVEEFVEGDYLPSWIINTGESIPKMDSFQSYLFINQIHYEVLRAVDGQVSIDDIAVAVADKYKMTPPQSLEAVRQFFTKVFEENLFQGL